MKGGKSILPTQTTKFNKFVLVRWPNDKPGLVYGVVRIDNLYSKKLGAFFNKDSNIKINEYYDVKTNGVIYKNCFALGCGSYQYCLDGFDKIMNIHMKREEHKYKHLKKFQTIHYDIYTHDETVQNDEEGDVD